MVKNNYLKGIKMTKWRHQPLNNQLVYHKELLYRCWLGFYRKKIVPLLLRIFEIFLKLTMDFQSNLVQSPWKSMFFFLNFWWTPCNCNDFYSTLWNFLLISSTGFFFLKKPIRLNCKSEKKYIIKLSPAFYKKWYKYKTTKRAFFEWFSKYTPIHPR